MATVQMDLPSNSKKNKVQTPIIQGTAKPVEKKVTDQAADAVKSAGSYILKDVLLPALKDTAVSMVTGAIQMLCYGEVRQTPKSGWSYGSNASMYHAAYGQPVKRALSSGHDVPDTELTETDADLILERISESISVYGRCPVAAVKQWMGISSDCMDENYGWTTMQGFSKSRYTAETVIVHFPRPVGI